MGEMGAGSQRVRTGLKPPVTGRIKTASTDRPRDRVVRRLSRVRRRSRPAVPAVGLEKPTSSLAFGRLRGVRDAVQPGDQIAQGGQLLCQRT